MTLGTGIAQAYPDLAVGPLAQCPAVLAGDPGGVRALLGEAGLVDYQHRPRVAQLRDDVGAQIVAHRVGVPGIPIQHALDPARVGIAGLLGQLPAVLALHLRYQAAQVVRRVRIRLRPLEVAPQPPGGIFHLPRPLARHRVFIRTRTAPRRHATHLVFA